MCQWSSTLSSDISELRTTVRDETTLVLLACVGLVVCLSAVLVRTVCGV